MRFFSSKLDLLESDLSNEYWSKFMLCPKYFIRNLINGQIHYHLIPNNIETDEEIINLL